MNLKKFARKILGRRGQALAETVLVITLISAVAIGAFTMAGTSTNGIFCKTAELLGGESDSFDISDATIAAIPDQTYTGEAIEPEITVSDPEGAALERGTDYTLEFLDNTEIGTATVTVTGAGKWQGSKSAGFEIVYPDINTALAWTISNARVENAKYVEFLGKTWFVIGCNGSGVYSSSDTVTLFLTESAGTTTFCNLTGDAAFKRTYAGSALQTSVSSYWNTIKTADPAQASLVQGRTLEHGDYSAGTPYCDGVLDSSSVSNQYLWPLSTAEAMILSNNNSSAMIGDFGCVIRSAGINSSYWLRSPGEVNVLMGSEDHIACVQQSSVVPAGDLFNKSAEVRVALRADTSTLIIRSGDGSAANPYVFAAK